VNRLASCYAGPTTLGIDVSHHQGEIDWDAVASSDVRFAYVRVSDGITLDRQFMRNWSECKRVGLRRGVYQYFRPQREPAAQVQLLADAVGGFDSNDLPPALDLETLDEVAPDDFSARVLAWLRLVEQQLKRRPIIYSGSFWHWNVGTADLQDYKLWTPHYGVRCPGVPQGFYDWTIWQYTSGGDVPGIRGRTDMNRFRGDEGALAKFVADSRVGWSFVTKLLVSLGVASVVGGGGYLLWKGSR
jgi:lysozyme